MIKEKFKAYCKWIYVLAIVCKIFTIIGIACLFILVPMTPFLINNITIDKNEFTLFGEKYQYEVSGNTEFKITHEKEEVYKQTINSEDLVEKFLTELNSSTKTKIIGVLEVQLGIMIFSLIVIAYALHLVYKLFKKFYELESPFFENSGEQFRKIANSILAYAIAQFVSSYVNLMAYETETTTSINLVFIIILLAIYAISYVFDYGTMLEEKN